MFIGILILLPTVKGVFVSMPRVVPRATATWTWVLKRRSRTQIQPRAQSSAQGLMGHLPKIIESQNHESPNKEHKSQKGLTIQYC